MLAKGEQHRAQDRGTMTDSDDDAQILQQADVAMKRLATRARRRQICVSDSDDDASDAERLGKTEAGASSPAFLRQLQDADPPLSPQHQSDDAQFELSLTTLRLDTSPPSCSVRSSKDTVGSGDDDSDAFVSCPSSPSAGQSVAAPLQHDIDGFANVLSGTNPMGDDPAQAAEDVSEPPIDDQHLPTTETLSRRRRPARIVISDDEDSDGDSPTPNAVPSIETESDDDEDDDGEHSFDDLDGFIIYTPPRRVKPKRRTELDVLPAVGVFSKPKSAGSDDDATTAVPETPRRDRWRLPKTPHRESNALFWDEGEHDRIISSAIAGNGSDDDDERPARPPSPVKPHVTSAERKRRDRQRQAAEKEAMRERRGFIAEREALAKELLDEYVSKICPELITPPSQSNSTTASGCTTREPARKNVLYSIDLIWSKTLNTTAGRANYSRSMRSGRIELSTKVLTSAARLRDTLAHELCHLLAWCMDDDFDRPHGPAFRRWAAACEQKLGVHVGTTHSYEVEYKYVWTCSGSSAVIGETPAAAAPASSAGCGREYGRHSKSIDVTKVVCGACKGKLVQTKPKPRAANATAPSTPAPARTVLGAIEVNAVPATAATLGAKPQLVGSTTAATPSGLDRFAAFRREHLEQFRRENPGMQYKELMQRVTQAYRVAHPSPVKKPRAAAPTPGVGTSPTKPRGGRGGLLETESLAEQLTSLRLL